MKVTEKWIGGVLVWFSPDHPNREFLLANQAYQEAIRREMDRPWYVRLLRFLWRER